MSSREILWVDLETTGLDHSSDQILEVAAVLTNMEGDIIDNRIHVIDAKVDWDTLNQTVVEMHTESGLRYDLDTGIKLVDADFSISNMISSRTKYSPPLGGNSVHFDERFLQRNMPMTFNWLHYHHINVSVLDDMMKNFNQAWYDEEFGREGKTAHRAYLDIMRSIKHYRAYRRIFRHAA